MLNDLEVAPRVVAKDTTEMTDLKAWVDRNLDEGFQYKIFDRYRLISEFCYGPTLRPQQRPGFTDFRWVNHSLWRLYTQIQPVIIYCLPPLWVIKSNLEFDNDNDVVRDHIDQIYAAYLERAALDRMILPRNVVVWNYTLDDIVERNSYSDIPGISPSQLERNLLSPILHVINYAKDRVNA